MVVTETEIGIDQFILLATTMVVITTEGELKSTDLEKQLEQTHQLEVDKHKYNQEVLVKWRHQLELGLESQVK